MKKTVLILSLALAFAGCKKDNAGNDNNKQQDVSFVGDWKYTRDYGQIIDSKGNVTFEQDQTTFPDSDHIVYHADGSAHGYLGGDEVLFTYTYKTGVLIETIGPQQIHTYKVEITGNKMHRYSEEISTGGKSITDSYFVRN